MKRSMRCSFSGILVPPNAAICVLAVFASALPHADAAPQPIWDYTAGDRLGLVWRASLGTQMGSLVVSGNRVLVGTNNSPVPDDPARPDESVLLCVSAETGKTLWRARHPRLSTRTNDLPEAPIVSRPCVEEGEVYYVSNRGGLSCVDLSDGHRRWTLDMVKDLGVFKRDPSDIAPLVPSPIVCGDLVYCVTGNGIDGSMKVLPHPDAPSFIAVDKRTGKLVWSSNAPGRGIFYGQWSTPACADVLGVREVLFPGGDGFLYAFDRGTNKLLWRSDCRGEDPLKWPDMVVAPPLVSGHTVFVSVNRDFEGGTGPRPIYAVDVSTGKTRWKYLDKDFDGTFGPMALAGDHLVAVAASGLLVAIDARTGSHVWQADLNYSRAGVCLDHDRLYIANDEAVLVISARDGKTLQTYRFGGFPRGTPAVKGGKLFAMADGYLWCLRLPDR